MSRSGTEVRQRCAQVGVRLLPVELEMLSRQAERDGVSLGEALRGAFLRELGLGDGQFLRETYDLALELQRFRAGDIADAFGISLQNANNRCAKLLALGALSRERIAGPGNEFMYVITRRP